MPRARFSSVIITTANTTSIESRVTISSPLLPSSKSDRRDYAARSLSARNSGRGPTLWIDPSAENLLLGADKSNKKNLRDDAIHGDNLVTKDRRNSQGPRLLRSITGGKFRRPGSSLSLTSRSPTELARVNSELRKIRAQSVEFGNRLSSKHSQGVRVPKKRTTATSATTIASSVDDPFFDARSRLGGNDDNLERLDSTQIQQIPVQNAILNEGSVTPMNKQAKNGIPSKAKPVRSHLLRTSSQEHVNKKELKKPIKGGRYSGSHVNTTHVQTVSTSIQSDQRPTSSSTGSFPPRSSSRSAAPDYTTKRCSPQSQTSELGDNIISGTFPSGPKSTVSEPAVDTHHVTLVTDDAKGDSTTHLSTPSETSNGVLSEARAFISSRISSRASDRESLNIDTKKQRIRNTRARSPFPSLADVHPVYRPTIASSLRANQATSGTKSAGMTSPVSPQSRLSHGTRQSDSTRLAIELLEASRLAPPSPKKERLLELGTLVVKALTEAHNTEIAMEEAKQAARRAELSSMLCTQSLAEIAKCVRDWKREARRDTR